MPTLFVFEFARLGSVGVYYTHSPTGSSLAFSGLLASKQQNLDSSILTSVAVLARTLVFRRRPSDRPPALPPFGVPPGTALIAVVRLESKMGCNLT